MGTPNMAWTEVRKRAFCDALRQTGGNFTAAAAMVTPHSSAQSQPGFTSCKAAMKADPTFAIMVEETLAEVRDDVYSVIWDLAVNGEEKGVYGKGQRIFEPVLDDAGEIVRDADGNPKMQAATEVRRDPRLLLRLMSRLDPSWRESRNIDVTHRAEGALIQTSDLIALSPDQRQQLTGILTTIEAAREGQDAPALPAPTAEAEMIDADFSEVPAEAPLEAWEGID